MSFSLKLTFDTQDMVVLHIHGQNHANRWDLLLVLGAAQEEENWRQLAARP